MCDEVPDIEIDRQRKNSYFRQKIYSMVTVLYCAPKATSLKKSSTYIAFYGT